MKVKLSRPLFAAAALVALAGVGTAAEAHGDVFFSLGVNAAPGVAVGVSNVPPMYVAPQPVYVAPQAVYVEPQPVYIAPPMARVVVAPAPYYVGPGWHRGWHHDRGWHHGHDRH